jgi:hypothetical protein
MKADKTLSKKQILVSASIGVAVYMLAPKASRDALQGEFAAWSH